MTLENSFQLEHSAESQEGKCQHFNFVDCKRIGKTADARLAELHKFLETEVTSMRV